MKLFDPESFVDKFYKAIVISPDKPFFHIWKIFVLIISITSSCMYAVFAAFRDDVDYAGVIDYLDNFDFGTN